MTLTEEEIIHRLAVSYDPTKPTDSPYPPETLDGSPQCAAVLIPFLNDGHGWRLLFIRRTEKQDDRHGGQVAFPGGRCNIEDPDPETVALREAHEEVGIDPTEVRILGRLNDMMTITNYRVTPIVGVIPWPYPIKRQASEVSRVFTIPLAWLTNPNNRIIHQRSLPNSEAIIPVIYYHPYHGEVLWGASARMTHKLIKALALG
jgi:8-oxo-dGTP pyrophosphatase MutT (NUDIX family)